MDLLLFLTTLLGLQTHSNGQDLNLFVAEHKQALETYIMAGYGGGWKECDLLAIYPTENNLSPNTPQFVLDMASLRGFDIKASFSNSHCLLIMAHIESFSLGCSSGEGHSSGSSNRSEPPSQLARNSSLLFNESNNRKY